MFLIKDVQHIIQYRWIEGNALDLPFADSYFDAVTIGYGLRNVPDVNKTMAEIHRVLKPGSKVSVLDFNKSVNPLATSIQVLSQEAQNVFYAFNRCASNLF